MSAEISLRSHAAIIDLKLVPEPEAKTTRLLKGMKYLRYRLGAKDRECLAGMKE